jgi:hypothetical protein
MITFTRIISSGDDVSAGQPEGGSRFFNFKVHRKKRAPAMMGICARAKLSSKLRASLRLALKGRDLTVAMPKFYVLTIDELPGVFFRGLVVGAYKPDCPADMTVLVKDVRSILGHCGIHASSRI